MNNENNFALTK